MHYTPCGTPQQDRSCLGLIFADPASVKQAVRGEMAGQYWYSHPAGRVRLSFGCRTEDSPRHGVLNLAPHMHLRGKSFRFEVEQPDGHRQDAAGCPAI